MGSTIDIFGWLFGSILYFGPIFGDLLLVLAVWFLFSVFDVSRKYFALYFAAVLVQLFLPTLSNLLPLRSLNEMLGSDTATSAFMIYTLLQAVLVNTLGSFVLLFIALRFWFRKQQSAKLGVL
jgi:hypothetical protein